MVIITGTFSSKKHLSYLLDLLRLLYSLKSRHSDNYFNNTMMHCNYAMSRQFIRIWLRELHNHHHHWQHSSSLQQRQHCEVNSVIASQASMFLMLLWELQTATTTTTTIHQHSASLQQRQHCEVNSVIASHASMFLVSLWELHTSTTTTTTLMSSCPYTDELDS